MTNFRVIADDPVPITPEGLVRVQVPGHIAYNLERMEHVTRQIVARLGCEACHSGWDIRFELQKNFVVNEEGQVKDNSAIPINLP